MHWRRTFIRDCNRFFTESQSKAKMIEYIKEIQRVGMKYNGIDLVEAELIL